MSNTRETLRALVSAFNVNNYDFNAVKTNFKLQSEGKKDYIVVSFEKSMDTYQCSRYLDSIKRKIIREFYGIEESNDAEILDTAKKDFDVTSFPFNYIYKGDWSVDKQGRIEFVAPVDQGVIFNLKSHLAASLAKDVLENMQVSSTAVPFNKKKYLWCGEFDNEGLRKKFEREFLFRMRERYENVPDKLLKVKGDDVYIRDVFDDARFIDSITRRAAWRIGIDLGIGNDVDHSVMLLKDSIINSVYQSTKIIVVGFICVSPLNREEASILLPLVLDGGRKRILTNEEALKLNCAFNYAVFNDLYGRTQGELSVDGRNVVYGIDFSNKEISHCVITKIIESSVINKDHELAIDPERALSRSPSTELSDMEWESPTGKSQGKIGESPRRGLEKKEGLLYNQLGLAVAGPSSAPSAGPSLWPQSGPSSSRGAAQNVSAGTSQPIGFWSSPTPSAGLWSLPQSGPSSWKGASERRTSDKPLTEEEKNLFKALLYAFNLNNYILECPNTNFIVKNGEIASSINDGVNVKEYLKELRNSTIEEYYHTEEKAKEACDLNEFPFKFLSNCEKNQETTVIANISRGALFNLKKLFIREHEGKVEIKDIDINIVKKDVESKKDEWVDSQVKKGMVRPREAITTCYPDESKLKYIPIIKDKGGYCLDRTYENWEVESFLEERRCAKGTSKAKKMKSEDNKDSGISSGEATTSSGYEFMDCENTRGGSPKCTLELSMGMEGLAISTDLDATKVEQHSPIKKFRSN